ncbi:MAG: S41 family peptidase [Bacteroidetes bacterium]|nr:S41 family peptidase [Bacteroidota bacterium]MDA0903110.1 S41 family peptidase [Bacteroidota bacterium]MDA1242357.1 S41 family peptidase [Bacteroidota bacterium]
MKCSSTLVLLILCFLSCPLASRAQSISPQDGAQKFGTLMRYIDQLYVDSVDLEALLESSIVHMLEELDPHSVYFSAEELKEADEPLNGNFEGIGVQFNIFRDTILVVSPISGGPSERLGIRAGDRIVEVDGENVAGIGITNKDVMGLLKGPKGTIVQVGIAREGIGGLLDFDITRDQIPIYSIDAVHMVDDHTGYVKVSRFAKTTMDEFREALVDLQGQGMKDLILDLQGNGGGMLQTAVDMSDEFLSGDKLIVYTEGRAFEREDRDSQYKGLFEKGSLVVLIDEASASASEIVSGAVQDWDRGLIVGRRSFGKGLVQRPMRLPDGSAVRLTVQKYYTPSGRCIQKPYDDGVEAYRKEKFERYAKGEFMSLDSLDLPDSLMYTTRLQGREVYGGGGILPDIFVPLDTTYNSETFARILRKGLCSKYALEQVDGNRADWESRHTNEDDFVRNMAFSAQELEEFKSFVSAEGVEIMEDEWSTSLPAIELRLKAFYGRNIYNSRTFYRVIGGLNESLQTAIRVLNDGTFKEMNLAHKTF